MDAVDRLIKIWYDSIVEFGRALEDFVNNLPAERAHFWSIDLWLWLQHQRDLGMKVDYASYRRLRAMLDQFRDQFLAEGVPMLSAYVPSAEQTARELAGIRERNNRPGQPSAAARAVAFAAEPTEPSPSPAPASPPSSPPASTPSATATPPAVPGDTTTTPKSTEPITVTPASTTPQDSTATTKPSGGTGRVPKTPVERNTDSSLAGMVKYSVRMANRAKAQTEQDLLTLGDLADRDAAEGEIEGQYRRVAKDVAEYESWLTQAYPADERYVSETSAPLRDSTLQTSVLNLTLAPGGIPVSAKTYDAWKRHGATLDEQLRKSDARLGTAQKLVRATQLAGAVAGIASGGIETAAAEGVKEAGKYVAKEVVKLLLWEAVDYVIEKMAANGGTGAEVAERLQRARIAYFILRARRGRFSGKLGATSGKNPRRPRKASAPNTSKPAQGTISGARGLTPRNAHLAGKKHPITKIPFDKDGYPNFSSVALKTVKIKQTGNRHTDAAAANKEAGLQYTPKGYIWHHHQDGKTMQLVPRAIHEKTGHTGGVATQKNSGDK